MDLDLDVTPKQKLSPKQTGRESDPKGGEEEKTEKLQLKDLESLECPSWIGTEPFLEFRFRGQTVEDRIKS